MIISGVLQGHWIVSVLVSVLILGSFGFSQSAFAETIFGSAFIQGGPATLYSINPLTGAATPIGTGIGYDRVGAIDFAPDDGLLYGIGQCNSVDGDCPGGGVDDGNPALITIDTTTGVGTFVALIDGGFGGTYTDMSFRETDSVLFAFDNNFQSLVTINRATGDTFEIDLLNSGSGNGMSFGSPTLYHADDFDLSVIDQTDASDISSVGLDYSDFPVIEFIDPRINAMDKDESSGTMFASVNIGSGDGHLNHFGSVNLSTGVVTDIGQTVDGLDGIAVQLEQFGEPAFSGTIFGSAHQPIELEFETIRPATLYSINPDTGAATEIGPIGYDRVGALDFAPDDGKLYGIGECNSVDGDCPEEFDEFPVLLTIDTTTGVGTFVTEFNDGVFLIESGSFTDISFRETDSVLFAYDNDPQELVTIDRDTGEVTSIGPPFLCCSGNGLSFGSPTLYHANDSDLTVLDQTDAFDISFVELDYDAFSEFEGFARINAMDKGTSSFSLFASVNLGQGGFNPLNHFGSVSLSTGVVTDIGQTVDGLDGLAIQSEPPPEPPQVPIGGTILPIDTTALLVTGSQMMSPWLILGGLSIIGIGFVIFTLKRRR